MDYDLQRLGSKEFEHLAQALVVNTLGAKVSIFGDGPDGGREASYEGRATWNTSHEAEVWDGYLIVQAKYRASVGPASEDQKWFLRELTKELRNWANEDSRRRKKGRVPDYLILVTNVSLSSVEGGGVDSVDTLIRQSSNLGLRGWRVWHDDQIRSMLDNAADIRQSFAGLLTPGDVLTQMYNLLQGRQEDLGETLIAHAAKDLIASRHIRLGQAGASTGQKLSIEQVGVDLPARLGGEANTKSFDVVHRLLEHGDQVLRLGVIDDLRVRPHVVLVGGPGQGKTTLGQLITQAYRVALLERRPPLPAEVKAVIEATHQHLTALGLPVPRNLRWPIRIDLATYGDSISGGKEISLLRWIAGVVTNRGHLDVTAASMHAWRRDWPWLVVLDGLDEVVNLTVREALIERIKEFLIDAAIGNADMMVVITTRPQGYQHEFTEPDFQHFEMLSLDPQRAVAYARRLADVRHHDDPDMHEQIVRRVSEAAEQPLTLRLMATPLQVTIMSLLLEHTQRPPQARHQLFAHYYDTIYARELDKPGQLSLLLVNHRDDIDALHSNVGLQLQVDAEQAGDAEAVLPRSAIKELVVGRLEQEGHQPASVARFADEIVRAATDRLVLLVAKGVDEIGFEVRSLQEFMAAKALTEGLDETVMTRLRLTAPSAHWRNTWLLAAGRIFAERKHTRSDLLNLLREVDIESKLAKALPVGPQLALDLLADDFGAQSPNTRAMLLAHALEAFSHTPGILDSAGISTLIETSADRDLRKTITRAIDEGLSGNARSQATTWLLLGHLERHTSPLGSTARARRAGAKFDTHQQSAIDHWLHDSIGTDQIIRKPLTEIFETPLLEADLSDRETAVADAFLGKLRTHSYLELSERPDTLLLGRGRLMSPELVAAVNTPAVAEAVASALLDLPPESWSLRARVSAPLRAARERLPLSDKLQAILE